MASENAEVFFLFTDTYMDKVNNTIRDKEVTNNIFGFLFIKLLLFLIHNSIMYMMNN